MPADDCLICEYEAVCFRPLRILRTFSLISCNQGRKKKEYRQRQATLPEVTE